VTSPNPETNLNELQGVVQISPGNAWAAGYVLNGTAYRTLISTGTARPGSASPRNVWAVGEESTKNLVLHWNGRSWKKVQVQNPGTVENIFYDIDALSADEIWMVGESRNSSDLIYEARALHCC
jgi:hypothetical protein